MRTLAFDGRTGASGDMLLGALLDAGGDASVLEPVEAALDVEFAVAPVRQAGVTGLSVSVQRPDGEPAEAGTEHRHYPAVVALLESMALPTDAEETARGAFERLGAAEAGVHGTALEETRFHEVGADDAIADVTGVALLVADLDVEAVYTTPVSAGGGEVETSHGTFPVPPPAVVEVAAGADWSLRGGPVDGELLTPTGAALLAELATGVQSLPSMTVAAVGTGAGDRDLGRRPNVLRAVVGEKADGLVADDITVLETNLDDATPEVLGGLQTALAEAGARDVTVLPATMKKARPGHLVKVVVKPEDAQRVARRLAEETGTLGVREVGARHRWIARRRFVTATLLEGGDRHPVTVKVGATADGAVYDVSAEFDEAATSARAIGQPVRDVVRRAEAAARSGGALAAVILHVIDGIEWPPDGDYAPPSLASEGFIHCSTTDRIVDVAQSHYADADDPRLLVIDRAAVEADLRYEEQPSGAFPHLYAPLDAQAVRDVLAFPRDDDGRYRLPGPLADG